MPDFGTPATLDPAAFTNALLGYANFEGKITANQLAARTLDSNTQIAANTADSGSLANQLAAQKNPLEITGMRQQLGIDPSPNLTNMQGLRDSIMGGGGVPGVGGVPSGAPASGRGSATVPPEYLPYYQEASARTGIPVAVLVAQGAQESQFNPIAIGGAGEIGLHQILPSTARDPGYGMTGIDPATLRDPRTNINFAADYLKARAGPRTDFTNPATVDAALKNYNGGGDPNYVANVRGRMGASPAVASTSGALPHHGPDPANTITVAGKLADQILAAPPEQRADLYHQLLPIMRQTGADVLPDYPGDAAMQRISDIANNPDQLAAHLARVTGAPGVQVAGPGAPGVQVAGPGAPTGPEAIDPGHVPPAPPGPPPAQPGGDMPPGGTVDPRVADQQAAAVRAASMGVVPAPLAPPPNQLTPAASASPPQVAPQAAPVRMTAPPVAPATTATPGTGMNSPQVQQALKLIHGAAQIEMMAASTPNDPRAQRYAAAASAEMKAQAALIMQADSVSVDPVSGIQTHIPTGKQDPPANDMRRLTVRQENGYQITSQGGDEISRVPTNEYKVASQAYERDSKEIAGIADAGHSAQSDNIRIQAMRDALADPSMTTGSGGTSRAAMSAFVATYFPGESGGVLARWAKLPDAAIAEEFSKLALKGAGTQERQVMGARGGYQAMQLFKQTNPGLDLLPGANRAILGMQLIGNQADADYSQGAQAWFGKNEDSFGSADPKYSSLQHYDKQWQEQRQPQIYSAAMGALAGLPPADGQIAGKAVKGWAKGLSGQEYQQALQIVSRADPNAAVNGKTGPLSMQPASPAPAARQAAPAAPAVGTVMQGHRFLGGDPSAQTSWQAVQ